MRFKATIKVSHRGSNQYARKSRLITVTEIVERHAGLCSEVYKLTNAIGRQLTDEDSKPEAKVIKALAGKPRRAR